MRLVGVVVFFPSYIKLCEYSKKVGEELDLNI